VSDADTIFPLSQGEWENRYKNPEKCSLMNQFGDSIISTFNMIT